MPPSTSTTTTMPYKIDTHSHFLPPIYRTACLENGHSQPDGMPHLPEWTPESHLALMNTQKIQKSILSISTPGTHLVPENSQLALTLTRDCNAYASELKQRHPERFGFFASLPLPDVENSLVEIETAIAEGCDGFVLQTNYHGVYLGDEQLDPVLEELSRRKAVVFIHPTTPMVCAGSFCSASSSSSEGEGGRPRKATPFQGRVPNPMQEFLFDTARVVSNLFMSGTVRRCPDLRIILPHLGGAFPPLLSRWTGLSAVLPGDWEVVGEEEVREALERQFWFDLAGFPFPGQIRGLMHGVGVSHSRLVYGSDFPFTNANAVGMLSEKMDAGVKEMFGGDEIEDLYHGNAERLLALNGK